MAPEPWHLAATALADAVSESDTPNLSGRFPALYAALLAFRQGPSLATADALCDAVTTVFVEGPHCDRTGRVGRALVAYGVARTRPVRDGGEPAYGLPVWGGATCRLRGEPDHALYRVWGVLPEGFALVSPILSPGTTRRVREADIALALDDPRTQRAYIGDLALALGAPVYMVGDCAVGFGYDSPGRWVLAIVYWSGGHLEWREAWRVVLDVGTDDRLLALAMVWPADKRVGR
jgi:hypothetical protein